MQDRVIRFLVEHSRVSEARLREVMFRTGELVRDVGTVLIGKDAVELGLIDELGGLDKALAKLRELAGESSADQIGGDAPEASRADEWVWRGPGELSDGSSGGDCG